MPPGLSVSLSAGSLTVSITDMRAPVVGGSGGVYALCSAHLANVVMVTGIIIIASIVIFQSHSSVTLKCQRLPRDVRWTPTT